MMHVTAIGDSVMLHDFTKVAWVKVHYVVTRDLQWAAPNVYENLPKEQCRVSVYSVNALMRYEVGPFKGPHESRDVKLMSRVLFKTLPERFASKM
jgi:hypothetical protein